MATKPNDFFGMSDEDFSNLSAPPGAESVPADEPQKDPVEEDPKPSDPVDPDPIDPPIDPVDPNDQPKVEDDIPSGSEPEKPAGEKEKEADPVNKDPQPEAGKTDPVEKPAKSEPEATEAPDYAAFYTQVMAPFKANGKPFQVKSPEEVIQLMQMGANYTKKLQDIQPHRKVLTMLQNNDLLDEGKLSYLIDLDKKNPEAIKKLIKDSGIDPLEIDTNAELDYQSGSHIVSDAETNFRTTLDELVSNPGGRETVQAIEAWDETSKQAMWDQPEIMRVIHQQRETGVYDIIAGEIERRKILGQISANTPFLQAYKQVGDELTEAERRRQQSQTPQDPTNSGVQAPTNQAPQPEVVATRTAAPKTPVANGDQASAAATTRGSPRKAAPVVNPLAMSDEDFMNQFKDRL